MSTYDTETLSSILAAHKLWIEGKPGGVRADLSRARLSGIDLSGADLHGAKLHGANLHGAKLRGAKR